MTLKERYIARSKPLVMHPLVFVGGFMMVGLLFALQQWLGLRIWYPHLELNPFLVIGGWEVQYILWGVLCWSLWFWLGTTLQKAGWKYILLRIVPLSIVMSIAVEMVLTASFPQFPMRSMSMTFWQRLDFGLTDEFLENTAVFWSAFVVFRAIRYYEESRQKERALSQLAVELTQSQMQALRMQINPHFLFNTMNSISSLMHSDVDVADSMLEQLSSMLRISLERGSRQLISLREEMEFIEMYLALQDRRYSGRVRQSISIDPHLYDATVPSMLLQPLVENAYVHGLSRIHSDGLLEIVAKHDAGRLNITVRNSGVGLKTASDRPGSRTGVGLSNIRSRLKLHFEDEQELTIVEITPGLVQVDVKLPMIFPTSDEANDKALAGYGAL
jgi:sensor histidine kinase YesM